VPSAGARHSFETYLLVIKVEGVDPGLYRYLPLEHELVFLGEIDNMEMEVSLACFGQQFVGAGAATFIWTTIPYRMEWRYGPLAHRVILIDVGHVCQNLYLACEAIGAGTCGVAAYDQQEVDELIGVDGVDEFAVYLAPVGRVKG
jgi:SagB-type dehydrogenase family enzyme